MNTQIGLKLQKEFFPFEVKVKVKTKRNFHSVLESHSLINAVNLNVIRALRVVGTHWKCYRYLGRLPRGGGIFDLNFEGRCRSLNPRRNSYDRAVTGTVAILVFSCHSSGT